MGSGSYASILAIYVLAYLSFFYSKSLTNLLI
jgi:hypothetical protein